MAWACRRCQRVFSELPSDERCPHDNGELVQVTDRTLQDEHTGRICDEKYKIGRLLGAGGMGCVHEAVNLRLDQKVAVKFFSPRFVCSTGRDAAQAAERFRREATVMARARHPNVIHVLDFSIEEDGTMYIVMELLEGDPLDVRMTSVQMTLEEALSITSVVLKALEYVHAQGVVHRDLKPSNIFCAEVAGRESVKVLDFGIARISDSPTITHGPVGTWRYAAPEQLAGDEVGPDADVYSVGVILTELVTGRPGQCDTIGPAVPQRIREFLGQATSPAQVKRFRDASEMSTELTKAINSLTQEELKTLLPEFKAEAASCSSSRPKVDLDGGQVEPIDPTPVVVHDPTPAVRPTPRRWPVMVVGGVVIALLTALAVTWATGGILPTHEDGDPAIVADLVPVAPASGIDSGAEDTDAGELAQKVTVSFVSSPKNAHVLRVGANDEESELCQTSCIQQLEKGENVVKVVFRVDGFEDHATSFIPSEDRIIEAALTKSAESTGGSKVAAAPGHKAGTRPIRPVKTKTNGPSPEKAPPATPTGDSGFLVVRAIPQSDVYLDGRLLGRSPLAKRAVPAGRHSLRLVPRPESLGPGVTRPPRTVSVTITAGQTKTVVEYW